MNPLPNRRQFGLAAACAGLTCRGLLAEQPVPAFALRYLLGSCLYGYEKLQNILPEVQKVGATAIDIWPKVHGAQREQLDEMGEAKFSELLKAHRISLGCITQYKLGPFGLQQEMQLAQRLGCKLIVTGSSGPRGLAGDELKNAVAQFVEKMKPHLEMAEKTGVTIAIENHANSLIESVDSLQWLAELRTSRNLAIALAPYHLPQESETLAKLIQQLGDSIQVFYAWQHGMGCMNKLPKKQELLQLPGRGELDFRPIINALKSIDYSGWTEIFMHPFPRGLPILDSVEAVTGEINRSKKYLDNLVN
jgi:sugar phosphate isomerase/epimerase